jgi:hypothetical protein
LDAVLSRAPTPTKRGDNIGALRGRCFCTAVVPGPRRLVRGVAGHTITDFVRGCYGVVFVRSSQPIG